MFEGFSCETESKKEEKAWELVAAVKKEIEPLLEGCGPFFGGSKKMTLAEASLSYMLLQ